MQIRQKNLAWSGFYPYGYPLSRAARARFGLSAPSPEERTQAGRVQAARLLAARLNAQRDFSLPQTRPARAGEVLGMGLLTEILRYIADLYCFTQFPGAMRLALTWADGKTGGAVDRTFPAFVDLFPPEEVFTGKRDVAAFLKDATAGKSHREQAGREAMLLHIATENPVLAPYRELFDDTPLKAIAPYEPLVNALDRFFEDQPAMPATGKTLSAMFRAPILASPDSIEGQLEYIRRHWRALLPEELLEQLLLAQDILREETTWRGLGPGPVEALRFGWLADMGYAEPEAFSADKDWMPNLVLIAKSVYVWLYQLSRQFGREITRLDQIPNETLDQLANWGFTGLWLIGVWERSPASRAIKRMMGNPEAESSAYSLYDYEIAGDLGGEAAYRDLAARAWQRGIRLASDMVPNHTGIYSRWIIEHPDWFIQLPYPPFPSYRFTGPNLSQDDRVGLYIEDGYWNHSDAAVVFKRVDHWTGDTRYIYHGNDGTSMPWNDTAQLNFTLPQVREAVLQTILHVARLFPVVRFDAAMTLAKRHYQRLWFPKPGDAGAIPSRAEHGMSKEEFDRVFPVEFWREVVDRIAAEAPDTLLLAEAFWLMEGYFVRTLGMHRVYNSAFMNMLKMEDNAKYRQTVKNVLEFSPEVLHRFVNFMNNPDEETADVQFGRGDKYVGVAVLMVTMPGLPMFGHGQIEGFREKYGMEYRRAYWDETPDPHLIWRHETEIFPLMRRRHLFSGARHFALFDFVTDAGWVDENVFAYTNHYGGERALIVYNNAYTRTRGVLHLSTAINEGSVEQPRLRRIPLAEALTLNCADTCYYIFRDHRTGLEYLRHAQRLAETGLRLELTEYQYYAFLDWREVHDFDGSWGRLHATLGEQGVPSVEDAYREMHLKSIIEPFRNLVNATLIRRIADAKQPKEYREEFRHAMRAFLEAAAQRLERPADPAPIIAAAEADLMRMGKADNLLRKAGHYPEAIAYLKSGMPDGKPQARFRRSLIAWAMVRGIGEIARPASGDGFDVAATSAAWLHEWHLLKQISRAFCEMDDDPWRADMDARLVRLCVAHAHRLPLLHREPWGPVLDPLFRDPDARAFLQMNRFAGRLWINKEQFERLMHMLACCVALQSLNDGPAAADIVMGCIEDAQTLITAAEDAGYDLLRLLDSVK